MRIILILFLLIPSMAEAATYYVRTGGGTDVQCLGTSDVDYDGSGTGESCAVSHPYYVIPLYGSTSTISFSAGDTLIIGPGTYTMGQAALGGISTAECSSGFPADCEWIIPGGPDSAHPTRILGKGYDTATGTKPILKGGKAIYRGVIDLYGADNVEIQYLNITDNDICAIGNDAGVANPACSADYANVAIWSDYIRRGATTGSDNVLVKNVDMHGLASRCVFFAGASNWTFTNTTCRAVGLMGMDNDLGGAGASDQLGGTFYVNNLHMEYIGCSEASDGSINDNSCVGQGGVWNGNGDAWGFSSHGTGAIGNWEINRLECNNIMQDCFDGAHGDGTGYVKIKHSKFYNINGASVKTYSTLNLEDSLIIDNCTWPYELGLMATDGAHDSDMLLCRADATISIGAFAGNTYKFIGNTIFGNHNQIFSIFGSDGCSGTTAYLRNNVVYGGADAQNDTTHPYGGFAGTGDNLTDAYYIYSSGGSGCGSLSFDEDYNTFYNTKDGSADVVGSHSYYRDPGMFSTIKTGPTSGAGYFTTDPVSSFYLGSSSNMRYENGGANTADETVSCWGDCSRDSNYYSRGANWDTGAFEYGSVYTGDNVANVQMGPGCTMAGNAKLN